MGLLAELKRRNVIKVGAGYLVVAWLLIQVSATVAPQLQLPEWAPRLITLILLLGFPVALVLAWLLERTPEGIKVEPASVGNKRIFVVAAVLAALAIAWYWRGRPSPEESGVGASSIAVLPFVNMSGEADNEYFSDGISEEILNVLARVPELSVAARTSSFQFKGEKRDVAQIAEKLKVRMVLEGSVRKQADRVRITAQLIDAKSGFHLWSETYDRDLKDIFAIQDEIARAIGQELQVRVLGKAGGNTAVSATRNVDAHDLYLRGLSLWQVREEKELYAAIDAFERAIAADPKFTEAWGGLALAYAVLPAYTARTTYDAAFATGLDAAQRALALDPTMPEPYAAMGNMAGQDGRKGTAVPLLRRAVLLKPSFATAHQWLGTQLVESGETEAGIASLQRAAELDPRSLIVASNLASMLSIAGRDADAIAACMPTLEYAPDSILCTSIIGLSYLILGKRELARPFYDRWSTAWGGTGTDAQVAALFAALDGTGDRTAFVDHLLSFSGPSWRDPTSGNLFSDLDTPVLLMLLGENDRALDYVDRVSRTRGIDLAWGLLMPSLDPIRCDPRFTAAVARMGIGDARARKLCGGKP